ncbi:hypothetical protein F5X97DRAFT_322165 [Nemania serpens]|nr:hypothetical protein F5X97DRAFT_322165 [Nemania serpens]
MSSSGQYSLEDSFDDIRIGEAASQDGAADTQWELLDTPGGKEPADSKSSRNTAGPKSSKVESSDDKGAGQEPMVLPEHYRTMLGGRRYHAKWCRADYLIPNDAAACNFMDQITRCIWSLISSDRVDLPYSNMTKPNPMMAGVKEPSLVIDPTEVADRIISLLSNFAKANPRCQVVGIDISPIQHHDKPRNLVFQMGDITDRGGWPFQQDSVDFVHMQCLKESIPNWDHAFRQVERVLKPGGWIESVEHSSTIFCDHPEFHSICPELSKLGGRLREAGRVTSRSMMLAEWPRISEKLARNGLVNISVNKVSCPLVPWSGQKTEATSFIRSAIATDLEGYMLGLLEKTGWSPLNIHQNATMIRDELTRALPPVEPFITFQFMVGRKSQ